MHITDPEHRDHGDDRAWWAAACRCQRACHGEPEQRRWAGDAGQFPATGRPISAVSTKRMNMAQLLQAARHLPVPEKQPLKGRTHRLCRSKHRSPSIASRAEGYGMPVSRLTANDVKPDNIPRWSKPFRPAPAPVKARRWSRPCVNRMMGHFFGSDFSYMPPEHIAEMKAEGPAAQTAQGDAGTPVSPEGEPGCDRRRYRRAESTRQSPARARRAAARHR